MFYIVKNLEKISRYLRIIVKVAFFKLKYGKRLELGRHLVFRKNFTINIQKDGFLKIGDNCFFNNNCSINVHLKVIIDANNIFGESVKIYDHNHVFNDKNVNMSTTYTTTPIYIGKSNWFGSNVVILRKAKVGNNNVIGAGIILNKEIMNDVMIMDNGDYVVKKINYVN